MGRTGTTFAFVAGGSKAIRAEVVMLLAVPTSPEFDAALALARRDFAALPGLSLTVDQARRLWTLEPPICRAVLRTLVDCGDLCETSRGHYRRPSAA